MSRPDHKINGTLGVRLGSLLALCGAIALLVPLALSPTSASAAQLHAFSKAFAETGSGAGQLSLRVPEVEDTSGNGSSSSILREPGSGVAVDAQSGDVYVADTGNHRVDEYSAAGTFIRAFGWEVDAEHPEAKLQECTAASGCQAGSSGRGPGQFEEPMFVAVDNSSSESSGDIYVADVGDGLITKFDADGHLISGWGETGQLSGTPVLATGTGTIVAGSSQITSLHPESGVFESPETISGPGIQPGSQMLSSGEIASGKLNLSAPATASASDVPLTGKLGFVGLQSQSFAGIAVDHSGNLLVVANVGNGQAFEFDQAGGFLQHREREHGGYATGIAVDAADDLYVYGTRTNNGVLKIKADGGVLGFVYTSHFAVTGLALDPTTEDIYLDEGAALLDISGQCEPSAGGCQPAQTFGSPDLSKAAGIALAPDGTLYAADAGSDQISVFKVSLEANIAPATEVNATSAVLHGTVDPEGGEVTTCFFQYGTSTAYGANLPCLDEAGDEVGTPSNPLEGQAQISLHADPEGLAAGVKYHFRLRVVTGAGEELHSEDEELVTSVLPKIQDEEATAVTASSATLKAEINPQGLEVESCTFEWGISAAYGSSLPCSPSSLAAGTAPIPVVASLIGLSPSTTYHWRVTARNANGTEASLDNTFVYLPGPPSAEISQACPTNQALREANGSTALPDCRAYEMVTPPHKNGAIVGPIPLSYTYDFSQDGSRLLAPLIQCFDGATSCNALREYIGTLDEFTHSSDGWLTTPLSFPAQFPAGTLLTSSAESSEQLFDLSVPVPGSRAGREWFYRRHGDGTFTPIGPVNESPELNLLHVGFPRITSTADLSRIVYGGSPGVWTSLSPSPSGEAIYEYSESAARPFLVDVSGPAGSTDQVGVCGSELASRETNRGASLSADGRIVYFAVLPCPGGSGSNAGKPVPARAIYARIDGEVSGRARTVEVSAPACGTGSDPDERACREAAPAPAELTGTSADGFHVYFLSTGQLTDEASEDSRTGDGALGGRCAETVGRNGCNLYLYSDPQEEPEPQGRHLIDVSAGDTSGQGPQVQGVMATSSDGSHIYFVAKGLLAGRNAEGIEPAEGADNLYVYDAEDESTRFIATLPAEREHEREQWVGFALTEPVANITPDGRYLLFTSGGALTPDSGRGGTEQVYRYDATAERLTRVSIGKRGYADDGNQAHGNATIVPAWEALRSHGGRPPLDPSMSRDGSRVFFRSPAALTPGALDEVSVNSRGDLAQNIYEWEQVGTGECSEAGGCIYLISDGADAKEGPRGASAVELIGTDERGANVFFTTTDPLVPADTDTELDIYDARAEGGFSPASQATPCESAEACHAEGTKEAPFPSPGTPNFDGPSEGPGNAPPGPACKKGFTKKGSKCVKHHTKKHNKGKHKKPDKKGKRAANANRRAGK